MAIYELLDEKSIKIGLQAASKQEVMEELVDLLVGAGKVDDKHAVLDALWERENKISTGLENGVAVPHCKTSAVSTLTAGLGVSKQGIEFDAFDQKPSKIFFILIAETNNPGPHVRALRKLSLLLRSPEIRDAIITSKSSAECLAIIKQKELEGLSFPD